MNRALLAIFCAAFSVATAHARVTRVVRSSGHSPAAQESAVLR